MTHAKSSGEINIELEKMAPESGMSMSLCTTRHEDKAAPGMHFNVEGKTGKFTITPPTSPISNGFYGRNVSPSPSSKSPAGDGKNLEGRFHFKEDVQTGYHDGVFTISDGNSRPDSSKSNANTKHSPEQKYMYDEPNSTQKSKKSKSRIVCIVVIVILILALLAGIAIILAFKVFNVGDQAKPGTPEPIKQPEYLVLEGRLSLKDQWRNDLSNSSSAVYKDFVFNFTIEMDNVMRNSPLSDYYNKTTVLDLSPGSIKVHFNMTFHPAYVQLNNNVEGFSIKVEESIKEKVNKGDTSLDIDVDTVRLIAPISTVSTTLQHNSTATTSILTATPTQSSTPAVTRNVTTTGSTTTQSSTPAVTHIVTTTGSTTTPTQSSTPAVTFIVTTTGSTATPAQSSTPAFTRIVTTTGSNKFTSTVASTTCQRSSTASAASATTSAPYI